MKRKEGEKGDSEEREERKEEKKREGRERGGRKRKRGKKEREREKETLPQSLEAKRDPRNGLTNCHKLIIIIILSTTPRTKKKISIAITGVMFSYL